MFVQFYGKHPPNFSVTANLRCLGEKVTPEKQIQLVVVKHIYARTEEMIP